MPVIFDISTLGYGALGPAFRTGVFRSVENLLHSLDRFHPGLVRLCALDSPQAWALSRRYWKRSAVAGAEFLPAEGGRLFSLMEGALVRWNQVSDAGFLRRLSRRALRESSSRLGKRVPRLSASDFAGSVYHSPFYAFPPETKGLARVLTLHDLINLRSPELPRGSGEYLRVIVKGIGPEDRVACCSEWTRQELLEQCPRLSPERVSVIGWGVGDNFAPPPPDLKASTLRSFGLDQVPYFISVATLEKRKNVPLLIGAFQDLRARRPDCEARLVLVGADGSDTAAVTAMIQGKSDILRLGFVPDASLAALYAGSSGFALPSLYEGFGLPALEAMRAGAPVLASESSALGAVVGEGGWRLDPRDREAWSHALELLYDSSTERDKWRARGAAWASRFSWKSTAAGYAGVYEKFLK